MTAALALIALPVAGQIYRCEVDGTVTFSDQPCGPESTLHAGGAGISFVPPDDSLPELAEAARKFLEERRRKLARQRDERKRHSASPASTGPGLVEQAFVPWPVHSRTGPRKDRNHGPVSPPRIADNERYSPLNGPILGTRPSSAAFGQRHGVEGQKRRRDRQR
jgi:hypothetical protein